MAVSDATRVAGTVSGPNSGQVAIGTNIRQQLVQLAVTISPGEPAALEQLEEAIRLERLPERVTRWGKDFPQLVGRDGAVAAVRSAVEARQSVTAYGEARIGKTVLLRHLGPRIGASFRDGVVWIPARGLLWQDVGQEVVRAFYRSRIAIYLGPTQLGDVLRDLDALLLLDDVSPDSGIDQLAALVISGTIVLTSSQRQLAGESRQVALGGLEPQAVRELIRHALVNAGAPDAPVDPDAADRIGATLDGHPDRIITAVQRAQERGLDLLALAAELAADADGPATDMASSLTGEDRKVVDAVSALGGVPVGADRVAAVTAGGSVERIRDLFRGRVLQRASPQVRVNPWVDRHLGDLASNGDEMRARFVEHFIDWIPGAPPGDVADEAPAILALLEWAEATGRPKAARALATAVEAPLALAGRWGTWADVTGYRLRAVEALGLDVEAAIALNQVGVQQLGQDDAAHARDAFSRAAERAADAGAPGVAEVARRNLELIDGPFLPPRDDPHDGPTDWLGRLKVPPSVLVIGLAAVLLAAALVLVAPRSGLAIEPTAGVFTSEALDVDGDRSVFTITNRGSGVLEGLDVALGGARAREFHIVGGDCVGARLAAGESCQIELLFHPTAPGRGVATLVVAAGDGSSITAAIDGVAPETAVAPSSAPGPSDRPEPSAAPSAPPSAVPTLAPSSAPVPLPDLTVGRFAPAGGPTGSDFWFIPVELEVVNAGTAEAGPFPIVITADGQPVPFNIDDAVQPAASPGALAAGGSLPLTGSIRLDRSTALDTVQLVAEADSCLGLPEPAPGCQVQESLEDNNALPLQAVDLRIVGLQYGEPQPGPLVGEIATWLVPTTFELHNDGTMDAAGFWLAPIGGQAWRPMALGDATPDPAVPGVRFDVLEAGGERPIEARVLVPDFSLGSLLTMVAGCPPGLDPCELPEIALENNAESAQLPGAAPPP